MLLYLDMDLMLLSAGIALQTLIFPLTKARGLSGIAMNATLILSAIDR